MGNGDWGIGGLGDWGRVRGLTRVDFLHLSLKSRLQRQGGQGDKGAKADYFVQMIVDTQGFVKNLPL